MDTKCLKCAWRRSGKCGHPYGHVRKGSTTADACAERVEDNPKIEIKVTRETRESLMRSIHQMAVESGQFAEAEEILDYFLPETHKTQDKITTDEFSFVTRLAFGYNEGIYLDCYAEGRIEAGGKKGRWLLGTYKTLGTALSDIQIFGKFGGTLTYFATQYLREHRERFLSDQELRVQAIKGRRGGE